MKLHLFYRVVKFSILFILLLSTSAMAAPRAGMVTAINGEAWAEARGQRRSLALKSDVFSEDTLITEAGAKLQLLFEDDSILSMGPSATLSIADFKFDGSAAPSMAVHLVQGITRMVSGKIVEQNPEGFKISSPLAVIGIRGTITLHDVQPLEEHHFVEYLDPGHTVLIQGPDGKILVLEEPLVGGDLAPGRPTPSTPRPMTPDELNRGMRETSPHPAPQATGGQGLGTALPGAEAGNDLLEQGLRSDQEQKLSQTAETGFQNELPPVVQPPIVQPPIVQPPIVQPPVVEPPVVEPPVVEPPVVEPPVVEPPVVEPPVVVPPIVVPPHDFLPVIPSNPGGSSPSHEH